MSKGRAVFLLFADLGDQASDADLEAWSNKSYLPEVCAVPGVKDCGRYVAVKGGPKRLSFSTGDLDVAGRLMTLESDTCGRRGIWRWTAVEQRSYRWRTVPAQNRGTRRPDHGAVSSDRTIVLPLSRMRGMLGKRYRIHSRVYGDPGVIGARRYRVSTGAVRYMTVYEFETVDVSEKPEWVHQRQRVRSHGYADAGSEPNG